MLLEVAEDFKQKYLQIGQKISPAFTVSALNILNEAEIQFKVARNKRLHVEMAIIKLNFLAQAIELSLEDNQIVKKKLVDAHYPIRLKKIVPLSNISVNAEAKLVIETPTPSKTATKVTAPIISEDKPSAIPIPTESNEDGSKKNLLAVLQKKYGKDYNIQEVKESVPLTLDLLQKCWDEYAIYLEANAKHASAGTFKVAQLKIEDEWHFTVTVSALTAQKFVEQERMNMLEKIWDLFQNRTIQFDILVEAGEKEDVPLHMQLNSKQKYDRIAEQYPLVAALKKRCNLEVYF
jgi:DNA polymerase-3 subunit gamma/tau